MTPEDKKHFFKILQLCLVGLMLYVFFLRYSIYQVSHTPIPPHYLVNDMAMQIDAGDWDIPYYGN